MGALSAAWYCRTRLDASPSDMNNGASQPPSCSLDFRAAKIHESPEGKKDRGWSLDPKVQGKEKNSGVGTTLLNRLVADLAGAETRR